MKHYTSTFFSFRIIKPALIKAFTAWTGSKPAFFRGLFLGLITLSGANVQAQPPVTFTYSGTTYTVANAGPFNSPNASMDAYITSHPTTTLRIDEPPMEQSIHMGPAVTTGPAPA